LRALEQRKSEEGLALANQLLNDPALSLMKTSFEYIRDNIKDNIDMFLALTEQQVFQLTNSIDIPARNQSQFNDMILGRISNIIRKTQEGDFSFERSLKKLENLSDENIIRDALTNSSGLQGTVLDSAVKGLLKSLKASKYSLDEKDIQIWLADQLEVVGKNAYQVVRESEVHNDKRTDILVKDGRHTFVIEIKLIKDGGSAYGAKALKKALTEQLNDQYLLDGVNSGLLLVFATYQKKFKVGSQFIPLDEMIDDLNELAQTLKMNNPEIYYLAAEKILISEK